MFLSSHCRVAAAGAAQIHAAVFAQGAGTTAHWNVNAAPCSLTPVKIADYFADGGMGRLAGVRGHPETGGRVILQKWLKTQADFTWAG
jgi:hypothetical protein